MSTALAVQMVNFLGNEHIVIQQHGLQYTPVKPICDALGIDWEGQRQRIERDDVLSTCACMIQVQLPHDMQRRSHVCLPLDFLNGWLFGVDTSRVAEGNRESLLRYKLECYRVLRDAFQGTAQPVAVGATTDDYAALLDKLDDMTGELVEMKRILRTRVKGRKRHERPALLSPRTTAMIAREQRILDVIAAHGGEAPFMVIGRELYEEMGGAEKATLHRDLARLRNDGKIVQHSVGATYIVASEV
jgi:hypothetical protein